MVYVIVMNATHTAELRLPLRVVHTQQVIQSICRKNFILFTSRKKNILSTDSDLIYKMRTQSLCMLPSQKKHYIQITEYGCIRQCNVFSSDSKLTKNESIQKQVHVYKHIKMRHEDIPAILLQKTCLYFSIYFRFFSLILSFVLLCFVTFSRNSCISWTLYIFNTCSKVGNVKEKAISFSSLKYLHDIFFCISI